MNPLSILEWAWNGLPWYVHCGVFGFIAFTSIGGIMSFYNFLRGMIGKWSLPAIASLVIPIGLWLASFLLRGKHVTTEDQYGMPPAKAPKVGKKRKKPLF